LFAVISVESRLVRPDLFSQAVHRPSCWLGLIVVAVSIANLASGLTSGRELRAFVGSNGCLGGFLAIFGAAMYPEMLHSTLAPENSLTAFGCASGPGVVFAAVWWPFGLVLAIVYFIFISRRYAGKVSVQRDNQGFY